MEGGSEVRLTRGKGATDGTDYNTWFGAHPCLVPWLWNGLMRTLA